MNAASRSQDFWRARLEIPNYAVGDAARYAHLSGSTVGRWHKDTTLGPREAGSKLSYLQLIELAVVAACKKAGMGLADIRVARAFFSAAFKTTHPFATLKLKTDGIDLAMDAGAELMIGNKGGQLGWKSFIGERFKEFEYEDGIATRWHVGGSRSPIVIDPRLRFGAPTVSGVPTWALKGRWEAGEGIADIADDFDLSKPQVIDALTFEGIDAAAEQRAAWKH